ncbi:AAA family ATPase [Corynebacterium hadale]|uniref:AAA family ATPase n=1 Tax=Corynebacterium hadale TaxID=2026255 RepID=UPI000BAA5617|nr:AAA family ATPase [Corynebacterium hadale]PAT08937.1 hypothetical protein CKJ82_03075 [Corynebacterium hadale]
MRIHSLTIKHFRAIDHLKLENLPDTGVVIVHGPNEAGKSTILDALDLVLRERYTAGGNKVEKYAPVGKDVGPEVWLDATVGEVSFVVHKRWVKSKKAELTVRAPRRENFSGRKADDELFRILDEHLDRSLMDTLFLRQGDLDPAVAAAGVPSITRALDGSGEQGDSATEDTKLMQAVEEEYAKYWSNSTPPKPKKAVKQLEKDVEAAAESRDACVAEVERLSAFVDEVSRREEEIAQVDAELPGAQADLAEREEDATKAKELAEKVADAQKKYTQAAIEVQRAEKDLAGRAALAERVDTLRTEHAELERSLEPARTASEEEAAKLEQLRTASASAREALVGARAAVKEAEQRRDVVRATHRFETLKAHLARVDEVEQAYKELLEQAPSKEITEKAVRAAEAAENEVALQRKLRDAASAKLAIAGKQGTIDVDGREVRVDEGTEVQLFDGTQLAIGGYDLTYRAAQGAKDPREAVRDAEEALAGLLENAGCESVNAMRDARDAYKAHESKAEAARRRREDVLAGTDRDTLVAERDRLVTVLEELADAADSARSEISEPDAEAAVKEASAALAKAEQEADHAEAALKPYAEQKAAKELAVLEARLEAKANETANADKEFQAAETAQTQQTLDEALAAATAALQSAKQDADELAAAAAEADVELAQTLLEGEQSRVANMQKRKHEATIRITELRGRIEQAAGAAERADKAEAVLDKAETALAKATRRADAIRLLRETLHAHRDAARAKYTKPFSDAVRKRASIIYGKDVAFNFGDDLQITDRSIGEQTVPLSSLSGGAKEQLALLTRFAIADLVSTEGDSAPVPVVVDDALGATDPERLALMNTLFSQVGRTAQVLVLTCFPQRFDRVAAARTVHIDELKQAGSAFAGGEVD